MHARYPPDDPLARRLSGGFTLDEASRFVRTREGGRPSACPGCGGVLRGLAGQRPLGGVLMVRCESCGRGLVVDRPRGG